MTPKRRHGEYLPDQLNGYKTVSRYLQGRGVPAVDADKIAKRVALRYLYKKRRPACVLGAGAEDLFSFGALKQYADRYFAGSDVR